MSDTAHARCQRAQVKTKMAINGFHAINVKLNEKYRSSHVLYFKKHSIRDEDSNRPPNKTIFIVNVPPYATKVGAQPVTCARVILAVFI